VELKIDLIIWRMLLMMITMMITMKMMRMRMTGLFKQSLSRALGRGLLGKYLSEK